MKICSNCKIEKPLSDFYTHKKGIRVGKSYCACKSCCKQDREARKEEQKNYQKEYRKAHRKERYEYNKQWRATNKERHKSTTEAYTERTKERTKITNKLWKKNNPEKVKTTQRRHRQHTKSERAAYMRLRRSDPAYALIYNLRVGIANRMGRPGIVKSARSERLLACSFEEFKQRMQDLFWPGMSLQNYGKKWELDHIRPCADFVLSDPEQQKICFHWSNWQPLWTDDNRAKSDRLDWTPHESRHSLPERLKPSPFIFTPQ